MQEKQSTGSARYERRMGPDFQSYDELLAHRTSEGFTGDISPNVEHNMMLRQFEDRFKVENEGLTSEDAYFYVTKARLGVDVNGREQHDIVMAAIGDPVELSTVLSFCLSKDPVLLNLFKSAVEVAERQRAKRQLGNLLGGLAKIFGHESVEEWHESVERNRKEPAARPDPQPENPTKTAADEQPR